MNAQSKNLTRLAAALVLAMACGNTWAGNSITFEGAQTEDSNGTNNVGNIDANTATGATVTIRQINTNTSRDLHDAGELNQVGIYGTGALNDPNGGSTGASPLTIGGTATAKIGQGVKFQAADPTAFDNSTEAGTKNNVVQGTINGGSVYISQTGSNGVDADGRAGTTGRSVDLNVTSGTLRVNQVAGAESVKVESMAGTGDLTINQSGAGQKTTIKSFTEGHTVINQESAATDSTLTLTHGTATGYGTGAGANAVTINQGGAYQTATVQYVNGGYKGELNLDAHGDAGGGTPAYTTVDVKM